MTLDLTSELTNSAGEVIKWDDRPKVTAGFALGESILMCASVPDPHKWCLWAEALATKGTVELDAADKRKFEDWLLDPKNLIPLRNRRQAIHALAALKETPKAPKA